MREEQDYNWKYNRINSKGEIIFRHDTNQLLESVMEFLREKNIDFILKEKANMLWIYYKGNKVAYFYTTGRWNTFKANRGYPKKHYSSKGIRDFCNRFLFNMKENYISYTKEQDEVKYENK